MEGSDSTDGLGLDAFLVTEQMVERVAKAGRKWERKRKQAAKPISQAESPAMVPLGREIDADDDGVITWAEAPEDALLAAGRCQMLLGLFKKGFGSDESLYEDSETNQESSAGRPAEDYRPIAGDHDDGDGSDHVAGHRPPTRPAGRGLCG